MTRWPRAGWFFGALIGALIAWVGGFLLSSGNSRCVNGPETSECSGSFASNAWHGVGLVSVIVGLIVVIVAVALATRTHRQTSSVEQ